MFDIYIGSMWIEIAKACLVVCFVAQFIYCIQVESEMNAGSSILFTGLKSQMENTNSVNELRSCIVIFPCQYILGSKDDRKTKYPVIYWVCPRNIPVQTRLAESVINSCHQFYFLIYRHKCHSSHKHYCVWFPYKRKKRKKKKCPGSD